MTFLKPLGCWFSPKEGFLSSFSMQERQIFLNLSCGCCQAILQSQIPQDP
ncbi:unnamed protein product [Moneuplotes crassus]|uniref:Uncharacterized protein n=1 Tax=Euplotes crassus TaxID=5936 RepID=A0AAD2D7B5_EUPCR|nr:unnamed protein product [Moneuplotes crassus]